jgi:hypothetical protein
MERQQYNKEVRQHKSCTGVRSFLETDAGSDEILCESCNQECTFQLKIYIYYILNNEENIKEYHFNNTEDLVKKTREIVTILKSDYSKSNIFERKIIIALKGCTSDHQEKVIKTTYNLFKSLM